MKAKPRRGRYVYPGALYPSSSAGNERLLVVASMTACGLLAIFGWLLHLQGVLKSLRPRSPTTIPLLALRGPLVDRNDRVLASSTWVWTVATDPTKVADPDRFAAWLAPYLGQEPKQLAQKLWEGKRSKKAVRYLRLAKGLSWTQLEKLREAYQQQRRLDRALKQQRAPLQFEQALHREYPNGRLAAQVLGLLKIETLGKEIQIEPLGGLEQSQNARLSGRNGYVEGEVDPSGWIIPETRVSSVEPEPGRPVRTTLEVAIQSAVEEVLDRVWQKHTPRAAVAIVLEPHTGEILALANRPTFDPNDRKSLDRRLGALTNRGIACRFEPGSIYKPITVAAALQEKRIGPKDRFYCGGFLQVGRRRVRCDLHAPFQKGHRLQTAEGVLIYSCNVGAAQIGKRLGAKYTYEYARRFGLLEPTGVELPGEIKGDLAPPERWEAPELRTVTVAFGQGIAVTPLQLAAAYAVFANDGVWVQPHLVKGDRPVPRRRVLDPEVARTVREWLIGTIEKGTGKAARIEGYRLSGKTGTAQKPREDGRGYARGKYVASFIGFVPADQPRAVVLVMVEEPRNGYYGGVVAAPAFRQIAEYLLLHWQMPQDTPRNLQRREGGP